MSNICHRPAAGAIALSATRLFSSCISAPTTPIIVPVIIGTVAVVAAVIVVKKYIIDRPKHDYKTLHPTQDTNRHSSRARNQAGSSEQSQPEGDSMELTGRFDREEEKDELESLVPSWHAGLNELQDSDLFINHWNQQASETQIQPISVNIPQIVQVESSMDHQISDTTEQEVSSPTEEFFSAPQSPSDDEFFSAMQSPDSGGIFSPPNSRHQPVDLFAVSSKILRDIDSGNLDRRLGNGSS